MHEIGHVLGYEHGAAGVAGLMVNQLGSGERHLPGEADMVLANGAKLNDVITAILNRFDPANPPTGVNATFTTSAGDIPNIVTIGATLSGGVDLQLEGLTLSFSELVHTASGWTGEVLVESGAGILLPGGPDIVITDDNFTSATHIQSVNRVITGGAGVTEEVDVAGLGIITDTINIPDGTYLVDFTVKSLGGPLNVGDEILVMHSNEAGFNDADPDDGKTITVVGFYLAAGEYHVLVSYNFDPGSAASWTGGSVIAMDDPDDTDDLDLNAVSGTIQLGDGSSTLNFDAVNEAAIWPSLSWLVSEFEFIKLEFVDFRDDDSNSALRVDTTFIGIDTGNEVTNELLAAALLVEGSNSVVFNMDLLARGVPDVDLNFLYPIIPLPGEIIGHDLDGTIAYAQSAIQDTTGISGEIQLNIPLVGKIGAGFIYKEVGLDSKGVMTTDTNATVETITYLAVRGFIEIGGKTQEGPLLPGQTTLPKVGSLKLGLNFAVTKRGLLQLFLYADTLIPVDVASGLNITELRGGFRFGVTIEDLQVPEPLNVDTTNGINTAVASGDLEEPVRITLKMPTNHTLRVGDEFRIINADDTDLNSKDENFCVATVEEDVITYLTGGTGTESNPLNYNLSGKRN
jgi:hypothetical protein